MFVPVLNVVIKYELRLREKEFPIVNGDYFLNPLKNCVLKWIKNSHAAKIEIKSGIPMQVDGFMND